MKILLVGEFCTDRYIEGIVPRLSPEAPCAVFEPMKTSENDGMVGNVYNNLVAMMPDIKIVKYFFNTGTKTRYIDVNSGYQIMRLDENIKYNKRQYDLNSFNYLQRFDAIIISDYNKGFITDELLRKICDHPNVFVDTKRKDLSAFKNAVVKVNKKEYDNITELHTGKLIVTLGEKGAMYNKRIFPVHKVNIKDLSGAGDTFLAALAISSTLGKNIEDSIIMANVAATIAVSKPKTAVVTREDLREWQKRNTNK